MLSGESLAELLERVSERAGNAGDRDAALAIDHRGRRATTGWPRPTPPPTCPTWPRSLNNLSDGQADTGDRDAALASITEAVNHLPPAGRRPTPPPTCPTWPCR